MKEKKQLRSFDVYTTYVHGVQNKIMYIKSYNVDRFTNVLTVRFKNDSVNQFDISTVKFLKEAIRMVNCKIKKWRNKMAEYKNTLQFSWHGCKQTVHFVNLPHQIECQVYVFGNPNKACTIAYFDKDTKEYDEVGKGWEWSVCKKVVKAILYNKFKVADSISRDIYNNITIINLGKMEVFENGIQ